MASYTVGQVVKGKQPPSECPEGFYWRKVMGQDEFKLYPKKERVLSAKTGVSLEEGPRLTPARVAAGVRVYMQHEEGFKQIMQIADLSAKALQNLGAWCSAAANVKAEKEKAKASALARANAALRDAGLTIGANGIVQPIPPAQ
jgi:hypothetical protein